MKLLDNKNNRTPVFSLIVLTYNALDYTKKCLKSIEKNTKNSYELIIIDNNSSDGTQAYLEKFIKGRKDHRVRVVLNTDNKGVAGGRNQGIELSTGMYCTFLDNDTEVGKHWDDRILKQFEDSSEVWVIGKEGNRVNCFNPLMFRATNSALYPHNVDVVAGYCFSFPKYIIKYIGNQFEGLGKFWHEDLEFCARVRKYGKYVVEDGGIDVIHYGHKSAGDKCTTNEQIKQAYSGFDENAKKVGQRLLDSNTLTIYRDLKRPSTAYSIIADNLTKYLRKKGLVVFRKPEFGVLGYHNSKSFDLCNAFEMSLNGKRFVYLHVENDRPPREWKHDMALVDYAFTSNEDAYKSLLKIRIPENKMFNQPLSGFDETIFNMDGDKSTVKECKEEYELDPSKFTFISVGACQPRKGTDIMIQAFAEEFKPDEKVQLFIKNYGYGKESWVNEYIEMYKAQNVIHVFGDWSSRKIARLYRTIADNGAYVSTHRGEGFGMTQLEAVACGLKLGYTDFGGPRYHFQNLDSCTAFPYKLVPSTFHNWAGEPFYQQDETPMWAEPDIKAIRKWMRTVYTQRVVPTNRLGVSKLMIKTYGFRAVADAVYSMLESFK